MTSENVIANTIKGHGISVGDAFNFHGMASTGTIPTTEPTRVKFAGKVGTKYMLVSTTGDDIVTWEFGPSAKIYADTTVDHQVTVEARTLDNGNTAYVGTCEHGWQTGLHTSENDAYAVAAGHGEVSRPLYVAPAVVEVSPADITGAEVETARVAVRDNGRVFVAEAHNFGGVAAFGILVESGTHTLINDGDMSRWIRTMRTADGHVITDGLAVWDYNLNVGHVDLSTVDRDGWFNVRTLSGARSLMNAERVCIAHPVDGVTAEEFIAGTDGPLEIPTDAEVNALKAEHDAAMDAWAAPLLKALGAPSAGVSHVGSEVSEAEVWAGTDTMITYPISRPVRTNLNRRKRKATKVNARRVRGGF